MMGLQLINVSKRPLVGLINLKNDFPFAPANSLSDIQHSIYTSQLIVLGIYWYTHHILQQ